MRSEAPLLPEEDGFWYPRWREMWEESLDDATRSRIKRAVRRGAAMDDPVEARYAVTLARRHRRMWRWWPVLSALYMGVALSWLLAASTVPLAAWTWSDQMVGIIHLVALLTIAPLAYRRYKLSVDAERLNRDVVRSQESAP